MRSICEICQQSTSRISGVSAVTRNIAYTQTGQTSTAICLFVLEGNGENLNITV